MAIDRNALLRRSAAGLGVTLVGTVIVGLALETGIVSAVGTSFVENWTGASSPFFAFLPQGGGTITSGVSDAAALDGRALQLTLPAFPASSPNGGPNVQSTDVLGFGTYEARLKTADCSSQPDTGAITGLFNFLNDGTDLDGNGVKDNIEIDFEWLCAEPNAFWMTMWTDFQESPLAMKRVYREVDLAAGVIRRTCYSEGFGVCTQDLTGNPNEGQPATLAPWPGYNSATAYYTYGFTWLPNRVTWYLYHPTTNQKIVLWDYRGPTARIAQRPAFFLFNLWHTNNWSPTGRPGAVQQPNSARHARIDRATFTVSGGPTPTPTPTPTAGPTPTPTPGTGCAAAWNAGTAYPTGSLVSRNGRNYRAAYWTQGNDPAVRNGPPGSGEPWNPTGTCGGPGPTPTPTPGPGCAPAWSAATVYNTGATVSRNARNYQAAYWTQGNDPAVRNGPPGSGEPWIPRSACR